MGASQSSATLLRVEDYRDQLQGLTPLNALPPDKILTLFKDMQVVRVAAGKVIFRHGEADGRTVFLLAGEMTLQDDTGNESVVSADSAEANHPVAQFQPRRSTGIARTEIVIAHVDSELLDLMLTWDQSGNYQVEEIQQVDEGDWMTSLLTSKAVSRIPAANIQLMFSKVEAIPVNTGQAIITEGDEGDYYYIISKGRCQVTRQPGESGQPMVLAELGPGESFGEEALVSDSKRNATVTMVTDGLLMRLSKEDFLELLKEPMINWVDRSQAEQMVSRGATWLDVRLPGEYQVNGIPGSLNIPLLYLREQAENLDHSHSYIVYCDTGRRCSAAAFLLSERGFDVYVLKQNEG